MKKKFLQLLSLLACVALSVGLSACSMPEIGNSESSSSIPTESSSSADTVCEHRYTSTVTEPTCQSMGYTTYTCDYCGETYRADYTNQLEHVVVIDEAVAPTCTQTGLTSGVHCDVCGETLLAQQIIGISGHMFGDWYESKAPTETEAGEKRRDCKDCDHFETSPVAMLSHSHDRYEQITLPAVVPSCMESGLTEGKKCGGCGEILLEQETIRANGHNIIMDESIAPTCTQTGLTSGCHCDVCGETLVAQTVVPENGHQAVIDEAVAPTCTQMGLTEGTHCGVCGETLVSQEPVPMAEHPYKNEWSYNETHHWHETTCGCDAKGNYGEHTEEDSFCSVCELPMASTPGVIYELSTDGTYAEVINYEGTFSRVKIADTYNGKPVKAIYNRAFYQKNITEIIIPNSITSIGNEAFMYCFELRSLIIPNSVTTIGNHAFYNCGLESITIGDSVISIGDQAFYACYSLTNVTMGNSVTSIGREAFSDCTRLSFATYGNAKYLGNENNPYFACINASNTNYSSYTIHKNTKIIADYAFAGCERMTSITIPNSVTNIGNDAFRGCSSLASVTIGNSVTSIEMYAFYDCSSLTSIIIPNSVSSIGDGAFYNCSSLTSVTIGNSVTSIGTTAFQACSSLTEIKFEGTIEQWNAFGYIIWSSAHATKVICSDGEVAL